MDISAVSFQINVVVCSGSRLEDGSGNQQAEGLKESKNEMHAELSIGLAEYRQLAGIMTSVMDDFP